MTKIPSVELRAKILHVRLLQRDGLPIEKITKALTADRLALLTELRESGLLEERDLEEIEKECIAKGVQSGKQKRAISIAFGSNAKARAVKEFISNMDKK